MGVPAALAARLGVEVIGETIKGVFGLASATVSAAGEAAKGVGTAVGGALEGALSPSPVTVVNNVGMAGEAGKAKVTGGGTLPAAPKKVAKPVANANMPTEKLLVIAVNYLSSIEKTLEAQLNFERIAASQQAAAEKEAAIESESNQSTRPFKSLGEKLGTVKDNAAERAGAMTKILLGGAALAGFGLLGLGEMDTAELDRLKSNWEAFREQYKFIFDAAEGFYNLVGGVDGLAIILAGNALFKWRGALAGFIYSAVETALPEDSEYKEEFASAAAAAGVALTTKVGRGLAARAVMSAITNPLAVLAGGTTAALGYGLDRTLRYEADRVITPSTQWYNQHGMYPKYSTETSFPVIVGFSIRMPDRNINVTNITMAQLRANTRESDQYYYWEQVRASGANPRSKSELDANKWLSTRGQAWLDEKYPKVTDATAVAQAQPDATPAGDSGTSNASATTTADTGTLPPAATGSIDAILDKNPEQLSDAELRQLVEAQGRIEDPRGRTNNPGGILYGTGPLQEHQIGSVGANANSSVRIAVYDTPENGIRAAMENWRNSRYYRGKSVREGLGTWSGGDGADYARMLGSVRPGYEGTNNPQASGGIGSALASIGEGAMEAIGNILRASIDSGNMTTVPLGSQMSGTTTSTSTDMPQPTSSGGGGSASSVTPETNTTTRALTDISRTLQNTVELGLTDNTQTEIANESSAQMSIRNANASNDGKLECLDPNFPGTGGVEAYLQYYRMAA